MYGSSPVLEVCFLAYCSGIFSSVFRLFSPYISMRLAIYRFSLALKKAFAKFQQSRAPYPIVNESKLYLLYYSSKHWSFVSLKSELFPVTDTTLLTHAKNEH